MADDNAALIAALKGAPFQETDNPEAKAGPMGVLGGMAANVASIPQRAIENSQHSLDTGNYDPSVPMEAATTLAGLGMPAAEAGAAGIFGGKLAKTADIKALIEANKMREGGKSAHSIWNDTQWFKSPTDQKWKFEIPDNRARAFQHDLKYGTEGDFVGGPAEAMFQHPDLYNAYPQLKQLEFDNTSTVGRPSGLYYPPEKGEVGDVGGISLITRDLKDARSIGVHEMQHAVQRIENFAPGGEARYLAGLQEKSPQMLPLHEQTSDPYSMYKRLAGEVEARNAQARMDFVPEMRRIVPPWVTMDRPIDQQLVRSPNHDMIKALKGYRIE